MPAPPDYNDVPTRIREFRAKYPEGTLQPADLTKPYSIETVGGETYLIYCAAAFRSPDDPRPGVGIAWEPVPGKTNFTRGSEIQNAETSAWGRAIIAVGAADAKRIASDEEIRSAQNNQRAAATQATAGGPVTNETFATTAQVQVLVDRLGKLLPNPGYPPDWTAASLPSLPGLKGVLKGDYDMTVAEYETGLKILDAVA